MVLFGWKTVHADQKVFIRSYSGKCRVVEGPARVALFRSSAQLMMRYYATQGQYLEVHKKTGEKEMLVGPIDLFLNPLEHVVIHPKSATFVNSSEALIVYRLKRSDKKEDSATAPAEKITNSGEQLPLLDMASATATATANHIEMTTPPSGDVIERHVMRGPTQYVPHPDEWLHEFVWSGSVDEDQGNKARKKYGQLRFTKLRVVADQMYYNVPEVRTKDDTLLTVKLMIFFELVDIDTMLDKTHDPIADFINAAAADVIAFCATLTYEKFLEKTGSLNQLEAFGQTCARADVIGYKISKVVFRGFHSSDALQSMHDHSIQERTRLRLEADTEQQRQRLLDLQLEKQEQRAGRARDLERAEDVYRREVDESQHAQKMRQDRERGEQDLTLKQKAMESEMEQLERLAKVGVDLTKYLVAKEKAPDRHIRVDTLQGGQSAAEKMQLHVHEETRLGRECRDGEREEEATAAGMMTKV